MSDVSGLFFLIGIFFALTGHWGLLTAPDVYSRIQSSSTCSTTTVLSVLLGSMFITGLHPFTGKVIVITIFFFITNPITTHIITGYAWEEGIFPWRKRQ